MHPRLDRRPVNPVEACQRYAKWSRAKGSNAALYGFSKLPQHTITVLFQLQLL